MSRVLAGPWCGQILADLGAEVIKIERPGVGDDTRSWGPPYLKDRDGKDTRESAYFLGANRGKKSVTLDIAKPEGQEVARRLAATADVLIENYKAGDLTRYNLGYEQLRALNPGLIYCSITGFGQTGPMKQVAGYDFIIQAMGGLMSITGEKDDQPGGGPQKVGVAVADITTGMYSTVAILAALAHRSRTGEGQYIDMALLDVQVAMIANMNMNYLISGRAPKRLGNAHANIVPYQVFDAADGQFVVAVGNDGQFAKFCEAAGQTFHRDPRFLRNEDRVRNRDVLGAVARGGVEATAGRGVDRVVRAARHSGRAASTISRRCSIIRRCAAARCKSDLPHPIVGHGARRWRTRSRCRRRRLRYEAAPPTLGQHTREVLESAGLSASEIEQLRAAGV